MNPKLALLLKKSGFPQLTDGKGFFYEPGQLDFPVTPEMIGNKLLSISPAAAQEHILMERCYCPTLEELKQFCPDDTKYGLFPEEVFAYVYLATRK